MIEKEVENAVKVLKSGGTILYPTDTIWGIGCDATNFKAIEKVFKIKARPNDKSMIILVDDVDMLYHYVEKIPPIIPDLLRSIEEPTTVIYPGARNLPKNIIAHDGTAAIRIVRHEFCQRLISAFGKPIISTSANISGESVALVFNDISPRIIKSVDYIVNLYHYTLHKAKASKILRMKLNGEFDIIRQ